MMDFIKMKLEDVTKTSGGSIYQIYKDRYWAVKDGNIFFYRTYCSPQCNSQLEIMKERDVYKKALEKLRDGIPFLDVIEGTKIIHEALHSSTTTAEPKGVK